MNKHIFSLKGTKTLSWHCACYVEKSGMGGLKMDVNLLPLRVFTDAGTLSDLTPHYLYYYAINNPRVVLDEIRRPTKVWMLIQIFVGQDG